jgi:hypothetical protein
VSRPSHARPLSFDEDPWTFLAAVGLAALLSAGALLWLSAVATLGLTGGGWHVHRSASMGSFLAEILAGAAPGEAWHVAGGRGALEPAWLFWLMAVVFASTIALLVVLTRRALSRHTKPGTEARWATARDERAMAVPDAPEARPHRLVAGRSKTTGRCIAGEDCVSAVAFGPNGSGKTVGLIIPNVLEWQGSVVMTTAKPQDLGPVLARRAALGPVWVVAPGGAPGVRTAAWSPVEYATDADAADRMAEWLVDSSGMTGDPKARPWNAQARKYLKGLLLATHLSAGVVDEWTQWIHSGERARDTVEDTLLMPPAAQDARLFTGSIEALERSRSFQGPGQDVFDEREQHAEETDPGTRG